MLAVVHCGTYANIKRLLDIPSAYLGIEISASEQYSVLATGI